MRRRASFETLSAFGTPTVVHLAGSLIVSALVLAPWPSLVPASAALGLYGLAGLVYAAVVFRRARRQTGYEPVWQDWVWYSVVPSIAYADLAVAAALLRTNTRVALFFAAAAALGLLLIGIRNAWDTVTHIVTSESEAAASSDRD
jgi:hypothetical protein